MWHVPHLVQQRNPTAASEHLILRIFVVTFVVTNRSIVLLEWDDNKNKLNLKKHGLSFDDAQSAFDDERITIEDTRADYGEPRFIPLGSLEGRIVVIAHTPRGDNTRIISMRKANRREQEIYQKRLETH